MKMYYLALNMLYFGHKCETTTVKKNLKKTIITPKRKRTYLRISSKLQSRYFVCKENVLNLTWALEVNEGK